MKYSTFIKNNNLRYVPRYVINATADVCSFYNAGTTLKSIVTKNYVAKMKKNSNYAHPCPYSVNNVDLYNKPRVIFKKG